MSWKHWDRNKRSAHALMIDRSLHAKKVYPDFNDNYAKSQNRSDVEDWDVKGQSREVPKMPTPKAEPKREPQEHKKEVSEYIPTPSEKKSLLVYFHRMKPIDQFKDLKTTRNVVTRKEQVEAWKKNPKAYDVRDIDTQPKGYVENRVERVRSWLNVPVLKYNKENRTRYSKEMFGYDIPANFRPGKNTMAFQVPAGKGYIYYRSNHEKRDFNSIISHELGHQFNYTKGDTPFSKGMNVRMGFDNSKMPKLDMNTKIIGGMRVFNSRFGSVPYGRDLEKSFGLKKGEGFTKYKSIATTKDMLYRMKDEEQFSEWFSALVTKGNAVKKETRQFYNVFKAGQGKEVIRQLKQADFDFLKGHIGGSRASTFKIF